MYEIIKDVIHQKGYALSDMLKKIDTLWIQNDLTDKQREELIQLAREGADYTAEIDIIAEITEIKKRLSKLEEKPQEEYPEYVPGKWYYKGDKITYKGKKYNCIAPEGQVCTWNLEEYPTYWENA